MLGTSHRTAGIGFREILAKTLRSDHLLESLGSPLEVASLSTCNRFELYVATREPDGAAADFIGSVQRHRGLEGAGSSFYQAKGPGVVRHLFRVATGLESVVVGEPQILSQVRAAGIGSRKEGSAGAILSPLFDRAYRVGTRIREAYSFESGEASLSYLAVDVVRNVSPGKHDVMLIGTGKMVRLAARRMRDNASKVYVVTRRKTPPKGLDGASLVRYSQIKEYAARCDVIISATTTQRPILRREDLVRGKKVVVDLGMPRNVSPEARRLPNVQLFDLDDLAREAASRRAPRTLKAVEAAAAREADAFYDWLIQTRLSSTLGDIYSWADAVREVELSRALAKVKLSSEKDRRVVEAMGRRIVSKILARPTMYARKKHDTLTEEEKLELLKSVFGVVGQDGR
jgi:glutamyl-tRNA reductase